MDMQRSSKPSNVGSTPTAPTFPLKVCVTLFVFKDGDIPTRRCSVLVGFQKERDELVLPYQIWTGKSTLISSANFLLRQMAHVDINWVGLNEVGLFEKLKPVPELYHVWSTYIPDSIELNSDYEWIDYETVSGARNFASRIARRSR